MPIYRYDPARDCMVDKETGEPMNPAPHEGAFPCPRVQSDIAPYLSPVDGRYVSGRRAKRDDMARHNCIDAADMPSPTGGRFRSRKFARKYGLERRAREDAQ